MWFSFLKLVIVFPLIILLLMYVLKLMNKYIQPQSVHKSMQVIQQIKLSNKTTLSIVKVGHQYLVLAYNDEAIQLIKTLSAEEAKEIESYHDFNMTQNIFKQERLNETFKKMNGWWKSAQKED